MKGVNEVSSNEVGGWSILVRLGSYVVVGHFCGGQFSACGSEAQFYDGSQVESRDPAGAFMLLASGIFGQIEVSDRLDYTDDVATDGPDPVVDSAEGGVALGILPQDLLDVSSNLEVESGKE